MKLSSIERSISHLGCVEYCTALALYSSFPDALNAIRRVRPRGQRAFGQHFQNAAQDIAGEAAKLGLKYKDVCRGDEKAPDVGRLARILEGHILDDFVMVSGFSHMEFYLIEDCRVQRYTNTEGRRIDRRTLWPVGDARPWLYRSTRSSEPGNFEILEGALRLIEFDKAGFRSAYFMADRIITRDIFEQALAAVNSF